jgi:hypothetical protein
LRTEPFENQLFNDWIYDYNFQIVFHLPLDRIQHYMIKSRGKLLKRVIKEKISDKTKALIFPRNHGLFEGFDEKIEQMLQAGLVDFYGRNFSETINPKRFKHLVIDEVQPMSLVHLEAGFVVWMASILLPVIAFAFEIIVGIKDFIVFRCVFVAYIRSLKGNVSIQDQQNIKIQEKTIEINQELVEKNPEKIVQMPKKSMDQVEDNFRKLTSNNENENAEFDEELLETVIQIPIVDMDLIETIYEEIVILESENY